MRQYLPTKIECILNAIAIAVITLLTIACLIGSVYLAPHNLFYAIGALLFGSAFIFITKNILIPAFTKRLSDYKQHQKENDQ
jgi:hypothetical protein